MGTCHGGPNTGSGLSWNSPFVMYSRIIRVV